MTTKEDFDLNHNSENPHPKLNGLIDSAHSLLRQRLLFGESQSKDCERLMVLYDSLVSTKFYSHSSTIFLKDATKEFLEESQRSPNPSLFQVHKNLYGFLNGIISCHDSALLLFWFHSEGEDNYQNLTFSNLEPNSNVQSLFESFKETRNEVIAIRNTCQHYWLPATNFLLPDGEGKFALFWLADLVQSKGMPNIILGNDIFIFNEGVLEKYSVKSLADKNATINVFDEFGSMLNKVRENVNYLLEEVGKKLKKL